ncbi:MAG: CAAX prenyl protease-related protein [Desulfobacteraceae bacterium]|nr:CAAX prenyl protease-related protein [Desulfobacteraceae bacterium]MBC2718392.1 CAAX prenyl protease-related protein [Desulfobacteraceae bacterium]
MRHRKDRLKLLLEKPWLPYVFPFVLFLLLTGPVRFFPALSPFLYIAKTIIVGALLWFWRHEYVADLSPGLSFREWLTAFFCGLLVLVIWIASEGYLFQLDQNFGFDPHAFGWSGAATKGLIAMRLIGAAVVVPVMEELFWRSFLMRYLINQDFRSVSMGAFTWLSFMGVAILFGLEHHRVIVGIIAGLLYNLLLIRQKKLKGVILAHGVTNLGLGIYVLLTGSWMFW